MESKSGLISISRSECNGDYYISIRIESEQNIKIEMQLDDFAKAITGMFVDCIILESK
jgi:hypothetical protein